MKYTSFVLKSEYYGESTSAKPSQTIALCKKIIPTFTKKLFQPAMSNVSNNALRKINVNVALTNTLLHKYAQCQ